MNACNEKNYLFWLVALAVPGCLIVLASCDHLMPATATPNAAIAQVPTEATEEQALSKATIEANIAEIKYLYANYKESIQTYIVNPLEAIANQSEGGRTAVFLESRVELDVPQVRDDLLLLGNAIIRLEERFDAKKEDSEQIEAVVQALDRSTQTINRVEKAVITPLLLLDRQVLAEEIFRTDRNAYEQKTLSLSAIDEELASIEDNLRSIENRVGASTDQASDVEADSVEATSTEVAGTEADPQTSATETAASVVSSLEIADLQTEFSAIEEAIAQIRSTTIEEWSPLTTVFISSARDTERIRMLTPSEQADAIAALQQGLSGSFPQLLPGEYDTNAALAVQQFINEQNEELDQSISSLSSDNLPIALSSRLWPLLAFLCFSSASILAVILFSKRRGTSQAVLANSHLKTQNQQLLETNAALQTENAQLRQNSLAQSNRLSTAEVKSTSASSVAVPALPNRSPELDSIIEKMESKAAVPEIDIIKVYNTDCDRLAQFATAVESSSDSVARYFSTASPMLVEARKNGKYWVIRKESIAKGKRSYLLLRKDTPFAKFNELNVNTIEAFFALENKQGMRGEFELITPAIIEKIEQKGIEQWKLKQVGKIRFKENPEAD